jgi:hypothetical protein
MGLRFMSLPLELNDVGVIRNLYCLSYWLGPISLDAIIGKMLVVAISTEESDL